MSIKSLKSIEKKEKEVFLYSQVLKFATFLLKKKSECSIYLKNPVNHIDNQRGVGIKGSDV